ncbi:hypothetical protein BsWGS_22078 [Bradybaena similaris]
MTTFWITALAIGKFVGLFVGQWQSCDYSSVITALAIAGLSVALCRGQQKLYYLAPCQPLNWLFEYPGNCEKYLACTSYGLYPMSCPQTTVFDESNQKCMWPYQVPKCLNSGTKTACNPNTCVNGTCQLNSSTQLGYECVCQNGYTGPECATDIDECASPPRLCVRGTCHNLPGSFYCDCGNSGYTGKFCEIAPAEQPCINGRPCVNGKCQFGPNSNFCVCSTGYQGQLCDALDPCQSYPCANGGRCQSSGSGSFTCNCTGTGFGGASCTILDPCQSSPCANGGRCQSSGSGSFTCNCTGTGFGGASCTILDPCQSSPCANGGRCQSSGSGSFTCNCTGTGFGGASCTTNFCDPSPCSHGRCVRDSSGSSCDCSGSGYYGVFCDIPEQPVNSTCATRSPCVRGTCLQLASGPFCDCTGTGYTGPTCSTIAGRDYCYPGACINGVCVSRGDSYVCDCTGTVFAGPRCDMTACDFLGYNPCMNGGTCLAQPMQTYTCACPATFTGGNCETLVIPAYCPNYQCPQDVPRYNYPDWQDQNCASYYNCEFGVLQWRSCPPGQKFDVITMVCKPSADPQAIFCEYFRD